MTLDLGDTAFSVGNQTSPRADQSLSTFISNNGGATIDLAGRTYTENEISIPAGTTIRNGTLQPSASSSGALLVEGDDVTIENITFDLTNGWNGVRMDNIPRRTTIRNCEFRNSSAHGIYGASESGSDGHPEGANIYNNVFKNFSGNITAPVYIEGPGYTRFVDNLVRDVSNGPQFYGVGGCHIVGNTMRQLQRSGLYLDGVSNSIINSNEVYDASMSSSGTYDGIHLVDSAAACQFNQLHDNFVGSHLAGGTTEVNAAINETGGTSSNSIKSNTTVSANGFSLLSSAVINNEQLQ